MLRSTKPGPQMYKVKLSSMLISQGFKTRTWESARVPRVRVGSPGMGIVVEKGLQISKKGVKTKTKNDHKWGIVVMGLHMLLKHPT